MLSNKLKIKELVGSYWAEPLFFYVRSYVTPRWYDKNGCYFYSLTRFGQEFWAVNPIAGQAGIMNMGDLRKMNSFDRFFWHGDRILWNFWKDAIYDPEGTGKLPCKK